MGRQTGNQSARGATREVPTGPNGAALPKTQISELLLRVRRRVASAFGLGRAYLARVPEGFQTRLQLDIAWMAAMADPTHASRPVGPFVVRPFLAEPVARFHLASLASLDGGIAERHRFSALGFAGRGDVERGHRRDRRNSDARGREHGGGAHDAEENLRLRFQAFTSAFCSSRRTFAFFRLDL